MNILIIGATGQVGQHTIQAALDAGHRVRAFGRSTDKISIIHPNLDLFKGDALEGISVHHALKDMDVVILTHGAPLTPDTILNKPTLMEESTKVVIKEMQAMKTPRLICMSSIGARESEGHGRLIFQKFIEPVLLGRIMEDRSAQEEVVLQSDLPEWVILRPTELADGEGGPVRIIEDLNAAPEPKTIARKNVGQFLIQ